MPIADLRQEWEHFTTHRDYLYGPPRVKVTQNLGGAPKVIAEMDVAAPESVSKTLRDSRVFHDSESRDRPRVRL